jgi:hypothetical protein
MSTTLYSVALATNECPTCGVLHGFPDKLDHKAQADHSRYIYCPNGHSWHYLGETEAEKERRRRKWAEDDAASARARADQAEASLRTTKGHVTRLRKRVTAGACPFGCHRHFANLERHVATKHPGAALDGES